MAIESENCTSDISLPCPALVPSACWGQVSFPARAEQAGHNGQGREDTSHGQASRAPAEGCGAPRFLHGAIRAHSSHVQPGAHSPWGHSALPRTLAPTRHHNRGRAPAASSLEEGDASPR